MLVLTIQSISLPVKLPISMVRGYKTLQHSLTDFGTFVQWILDLSLSAPEISTVNLHNTCDIQNNLYSVSFYLHHYLSHFGEPTEEDAKWHLPFFHGHQAEKFPWLLSPCLGTKGQLCCSLEAGTRRTGGFCWGFLQGGRRSDHQGWMQGFVLLSGNLGHPTLSCQLLPSLSKSLKHY